jgi:hypothetical protein
MAICALDEVATWLRFDTVGAYLEALLSRRRAIFRRAYGRRRIARRARAEAP